MTLFGFFGPPNIEKLRAERDVQGLIKALHYHKPTATDKDWETNNFAHTSQEKKQKAQYYADLTLRRNAAHSLGEIGSPLAVEPLIEALADKSQSVRQAAIEALGKLKNAHAASALVAFLGDKVWEIREAAGLALGQLGDSQAIEPIIVGLALKNRQGELGRAGQTALESLVSNLNQESLLTALKSPHWVLRVTVINRLGQTGSTQAIDAVIEALQYEHEKVRAAAADALGRLGDVRAVTPLITALQDQREPVRLKALESIIRLSPARATAALIEALRDKSAIICGKAAEALGEVGDAEAVIPLLAALEVGPDTVRLQAVKALAKLGDASAIEPLVRTLTSGPYYWETLADTLVQLDSGTQVIEPLLAMLKREKRSAFQQKWIADKDRILARCQDYIRYLEKLGWPATTEQQAELAVIEMKWDEILLYGPEAFEPLTKALSDGSQKAAELLEKQGWAQTDQQRAELAVVKADWIEAVRLGNISVQPLLAAVERGSLEAATALGQLKDRQAVEPLIALLDKFTGQHWLPGGIAQALGNIGDARATGALVELLSDNYSSREALDALVKIGLPAVNPLIDVLKDSNTRLRVKAASALGRIEDTRATQVLVQALADSQAEVREAAAEALRGLKWKAETDKERAQLAFARRDWPNAIRLGDARAVIQYILGMTPAEESLAHSAVTDLVQLLEKMAATFTSDELRAILNLKVIGISQGLDFNAGKRWDGEGCSYPSIPVEKEIDSSQLRQLARQELIRRGENR